MFNAMLGVLAGASEVVETAQALVLPPTVTHFWGLMRVSGYSGSAIRVQRSSDNTEQDIGFVDNVLDEAALTAFVGAGTGYVTKVYDQVGAVDQVQATQNLMPIIVSSGTIVRNASGIPAFRGCLSGRFLLAAGAYTALQGSDFTVMALAQNNVAQITPTNNIYSPILGVSSSGGNNTNKVLLLMGARSATTNRNAVLEMASDTGQAQTEIAGAIRGISQYTTCLITANCQAAALTGGPGVGITHFLNRGPGVNSNHAVHTPANLTSCTDIRLFAIAGTSWTTNSSNGADCQITLACIGTAMTNAQRNDLEGQIYDNYAFLLGESYTLPAMDSHAEAWDFNDYANDNVPGVNGQTDLACQTVGNGADWALGAALNGLTGLASAATPNANDDFESDTGFCNDQSTFTMWVVVTPTGGSFTSSSSLPDFLARAHGALGDADGTSIILGKDHSELVAHILDDTADGPNYNMMAEAPWHMYSPFWGGTFLGVIVPDHDDNSDHPPFYTYKKFLGHNQTADGATFFIGQDVTYMLLVKHRPHPNYNLNEPATSANNLLWRDKGTTVFKAAMIGALDGFGKHPGCLYSAVDCSSTAIGHADDRITARGDPTSANLVGVRHSAGFLGGKFTSDAEDQALFYKASLNPAALVS